MPGGVAGAQSMMTAPYADCCSHQQSRLFVDEKPEATYYVVFVFVAPRVT